MFSQSFSTARPPTLAKVLAGRVIFQQAALADDLLFLGEHLVDVVAAQALVLDDDFGEDIFRLAQGQAQRRLQQPLAPGVVQVDAHLLELACTSSMILSSSAPRSSATGSG